ncbi:hypothetical protein HTZ97_06770 [Desulfuromonas acetoxidans]|uniref:hypothetical protein n=1 Tax=Desulfuromonas acetoxidans TaxID=891 RepID=UPI0002E6E5F2|nr:hypothetical protein [Desulfuromonas acetoxidans]MBF0646915.1 hypothetical protein [Desulfuromonas acetoxidans]NVD23866.1 hypothetical protein [Desulfuromonas acetoxidans]NVE16163.1 hypothetical protein [Desulfuromonas acetoxidans]
MKTEQDWLVEAINHYKKLSNALGGMSMKQRREIFTPYLKDLDEDERWKAQQLLAQSGCSII